MGSSFRGARNLCIVIMYMDHCIPYQYLYFNTFLITEIIIDENNDGIADNITTTTPIPTTQGKYMYNDEHKPMNIC